MLSLRSPRPVTPGRVEKYPCALPLCSHSFLCCLLLAAVELKVLGRTETAVNPTQGHREGQLLSGDVWVGGCGRAGLSQRNKGEPCTFLQGSWDHSPTLYRAQEFGAADQLSDHFLLSKSKSFQKKAGTSIQRILLLCQIL